MMKRLSFWLVWFAFCFLMGGAPFGPRNLQAQDSGALKLLYAVPVTAATCTGGTSTLTLSSVPSNLVSGVSIAVTGSNPPAWNGNFSNVTVSGLIVSYSQTCPGSPYGSGGYVSVGIPGAGQYYVVDIPGSIRLALGDNADYSAGSLNTCSGNGCVYAMGLSDFWDNKNDTEFDITSWTASGSTVTLNLSGSPTWSTGRPVCVFDTSMSSGSLSDGTPNLVSINGCFPIASINTNQVSYTLTGGVTCSSSCSGQGGFVYQVDMGSMDAGLAQVQFGLIDAPQNLVTTSGGGASLAADGVTVTVNLQNSSTVLTAIAGVGNQLSVSGVTTDTGTCSFNTAGAQIVSTSAGQAQYKIASSTFPCTGHGGVVTTQRFYEQKNSSGAAVTVLEANNVRVRFKETWGLRQYGQIAPFNTGSGYTNGLDCCVTGTEYYTIYRPDKVFHRWDMQDSNADANAPLTFGTIGDGLCSDITTQLSIVKTANFANNKNQTDTATCNNTASVPSPWQQVWQGYIRWPNPKSFLFFTPNRASWYGTVNSTDGITFTLQSGDNFAAGAPLASWANATIAIWSPTGNGANTLQFLVINGVTGSDYTGGTTLTVKSAASGAPLTGWKYYVGNQPPADFGSSLCNPALTSVGVLQPNPGVMPVCTVGPTQGKSGCPISNASFTNIPGLVHANYLRVSGACPYDASGSGCPGAPSPTTGVYLTNSLAAQWFEGMRTRMQHAYLNATLAGDGNPHTLLYETLRLGDDGIWSGSRQAAQAVAGEYAAEFEQPPAPSFTTGSCTSGYGSNCFDQDTGAYQITASHGGAVNFTLSLPSWQSNHTYSLGQAIWDGTNVEVGTFDSATGGASSGASGGSHPNWTSSCPSRGNACTDNQVTWLNAGNRYFHYPAFEIAGWTSVPSTLTVNSTTYNLNTDYVGAVNANGVIIQLLAGDSNTPGFYASGLAIQGSQAGSQSGPNATVGGTVTVGRNTIVQ
jgi:hypothetical protein